MLGKHSSENKNVKNISVRAKTNEGKLKKKKDKKRIPVFSAAW